MAGILTKGITLSYSTEGTTYTQLTNLMEIPEIGNGAPEKIETTTLADNVKTYTAGLGDSGQDLGFKFLYELRSLRLKRNRRRQSELSCLWKRRKKRTFSFGFTIRKSFA